MRVPSTLLVLALAQVSPTVPQGREDELRVALRRLEAPSAAERLSAERWLAASLDPTDLPLVAATAASAGPEGLRRLEAALGGDERHFELAAFLLADTQEPARSLGGAVMLRLVARWLGEENLDPAPRLRVLAALSDRGTREYRLTLRPDSFDELIDRLVRLTANDLPRRALLDRVDVVVDPLLAGASFDPGPASGPSGSPRVESDDFPNLLLAVADLQGAEVEGFGLSNPQGQGLWLHLTSQAAAGGRRADELLASWVRDLLEPRAGARRAAAARALGACGWSAPLAWLERRWRDAGDVDALEGLLLAASRGRVVPALATVAGVTKLLREADLDLAAPRGARDARARLVLNALAALPPSGVAGADLTAALVERFDGLSERSRFLRVAALSGMGRAPERWRGTLREQLARPTGEVSPSYTLECVRALCATRPLGASQPRSVLANAAAALALSARRGAGVRFVEWLELAGLTLPDAWRDPTGLPAGLGPWERALVAEAWLRSAGGEQAAERHWRALAQRGAGADEERIGERLHRLASTGRRELLARMLLPAPSGEVQGAVGPDAVGRLAWLAGLLAPARHSELLEALVLKGRPIPEADLRWLGPLAAGPAGKQARELLLEAVRTSLEASTGPRGKDDPWVAPVERAWSELHSAGLEEETDALRRKLAPLLRRSDHPLEADLRRRRWPPPPGFERVSLEALEESFPGS